MEITPVKEEHLQQGKDLGEEFDRMATFGSVPPDLWMEHATGSPVSAEPLLSATERALRPQELTASTAGAAVGST